MSKKAGTKVRIVAQHGKSALVEWHRAYVPVERIIDDTCDDETLERGIPHGIPWEELIDVGGITPQTIAQELRKHGLWTREDLNQRDRALIRIGTNMVGQAVWKAAKAYEKRGGN